jgi:hypothetical protein
VANSSRYRYTTLIDPSGARLLRPILPISLSNNDYRLSADALVDSGADANILPYQIGLNLGLVWNASRTVPLLSGILAQAEARAVAVVLTIPPFDPVQMVFIWVKTDATRLILGQINFFQEFEVCFFAADDYFEIYPKE